MHWMRFDAGFWMPQNCYENPQYEKSHSPLHDLLQAMGLMTRIGEDNIYPTVRAAVQAYHAQFGSIWHSGETILP